MKKTLLVVAFVASASLVLAQAGNGPGGGRGQGQGQGGGRGQGQGGFRQGGMNRGGAMQLLNREDVQKDLKITADQKSKLEALQEAQREEMRTMMENMRNGGGQMDREAMQKAMEANQAKQKEAINKILTAEQQGRLKQIRVQLEGNRILLDAEIQKDLKITAEQKGKIDALMAKQRDANQVLMEKMRNQELDREAFQESMQKNDKILTEELGKVLTSAQADQLKAMAGAKFEATPNTRP